VLHDSLKNFDAYGMYLGGFDPKTGKVEDEPASEAETVLTLQFTVASDVGRSLLISIVDDDRSVRKAIDALVRSLGYCAATFPSAEAFLNSDRLTDTSCPAVPNNSIIIGNMTDSTILQGSPEATQNVQFAFNAETSRKALAEFESALAASTIPAKTLDELLADVGTIQSQLAKPAPSRVIIHEAGTSLRNVVEGVVGGMLTPAAVTAATVLWAVLGIG
jgi:hypothetical protein